ncbi:MAG TPA: TetR/AcrR family transcriptional regulator [Herpetosiphonaceae bacterium]|nr:TetR/AcrR family transcriptional regulator [Herpetosiphonaceae bacterium]
MDEPKPRGRPRTFDRETALDAAVDMFWRHGYEGTSIADLTAAMGVTPPTLYAAFGSKEDLYRLALARYLERSERGRGGVSGGSAYALIENYLRAAADRFTDPGRPRGCMVSTASLYCAAENEAARSAAAAMRAVGFAAAVAACERAKSTGELPPATDAVALARFYSAIAQGMSVQAVDGATAADLHALVDLALAAWPGVRPDAG